ncbi:MAG: hypothetical protein WCG47_19545 [Dermatophilaceae bacterium]
MRVSMWDNQVGIQCDSCLAWVTQDGTIRRWAVGKDIEAALTREHSPWASLSGVRHRCPRCVARQVCTAAGHEWEEWEPIPHTEDELMLRVCVRCREDQTVPGYALAPARSRRLIA